jgi:glutamyl-tRNA reductase
MELVCIGLSYKTAPVDVRERLALSSGRQLEVLNALAAHTPEAMLVSTCNRVEFYVTAPTSELARQAVHARIVELAGPAALDHLYEQRGDAALVHLFRVAASLDSMVVGEPQILGQVKDAYELAQKAGTARGELARAAQAAFSSAKRVRSETGIGRAAVSMASAAVELAKKIFGELKGKTVLIVGAGEMAELAARHLASAGAGQLIVTNRTLARAQELAALVGGTARAFEELPGLLVPVDVVISSTASPTPIFTREKVASILKARKHRQLLMVDLAVPRDVAPDVNTLDSVYTADVDDIQELMAENSAARAEEARKAEAIVAEEVSRFSRARAVRDGVPVLAQLRTRAEQIKRAELEKTLANLRPGLGEDQLRKSFEALANALVNKLLHQPTARLRASGDADNRLADAAAELFGLEADAPTRLADPLPRRIDESGPRLRTGSGE